MRKRGNFEKQGAKSMVEKYCTKCKINKNVELEDDYCSSCGQAFIDKLPVDKQTPLTIEEYNNVYLNRSRYELVCEICDGTFPISEGSSVFAKQREYAEEGLDWYNWCGQCQKKTKQKIEEVSLLSKGRQKAKKTITELLKYHNLKTSDLPAKFQNWETDLAKLDTEYQVEIQQAIQDKISKQQDSDKNNGLSLLAKIAIGWGIVLIVWVLVGIAWYLASKKRVMDRKS